MKKNFVRIWGFPLLIAVLSASGLLSALLSDEWGDVWSWVALGVPVCVSIWLLLPKRRTDGGAIG